MKRFALAIALSCVLSASALAGEVPMVGHAPVPTQTTDGQVPTVPGEVPMVGSSAISDTALSTLLSVVGWL